MRRTAAILLSAALLCCACSEPSGYEVFVRAEDAPDAVYSFVFPVSDTLNIYDLSFYTRSDELRAVAHGAKSPLEMDVRWYAPSAKDSAALAETVYADGGGARGRVFAYRSGVILPEAGEWTITVRLAGAAEGFCGLGLKSKKNGTR